MIDVKNNFYMMKNDEEYFIYTLNKDTKTLLAEFVKNFLSLNTI